MNLLILTPEASLRIFGELPGAILLEQPVKMLVAPSPAMTLCLIQQAMTIEDFAKLSMFFAQLRSISS